MNEKFTHIENMLQDYAKHNRSVDEDLFNIGVALGRLLEIEKIETYRSPFFVERDAKAAVQKNNYKLAKEASQIILKLVKSAYTEQYNEGGTVDFSDNRQHRSDSKLEDEIAKRYCIQHVSTEQNTIGGDLELTFRVLGDLATIHKRNNVPLFVRFDLVNDSGEDTVTLYDEESIQKAFALRGHCFSFTQNNADLSVENFLKELEQFRLMRHLKNG